MTRLCPERNQTPVPSADQLKAQTLPVLCRRGTFTPMTIRPQDDQSFVDELVDLIADHLRDDVRPPERRVVTSNFYARQMAPEAVALEFEHVRGSDLLVARIQAFLAFGGDLPFDVVLIVGFDGVQSSLVEARFSVRPDRAAPVTSARTRTVPLHALVQEAIFTSRGVYREIAPGDLRPVSDLERQDVYVKVMAANRFASRRRVSDDELQFVDEVYRLAIARRENPVAAVQRDLRLPNRNVARKWVQSARRRGFLAPAPGERRGGLIQ